ncbi:alpha-1,4-glucan--maltose-1-phosphate maltosyltransferase [Sphingomonas desiccabilis]|uniref:Alpha-1,4-glucan:maltose-1-phosphate maltosyltransferase n=1 Tax=Sphingomonas desiccabilis TaxID=429134 RepID=A0A4V1QP08_9SPHN|nr:alpha-1,4-glucan--maltose-1-phosphate maltosyltransferase [Sphingomonas desiccabilis]MBB3911763.1 starch synthase (maltosyl-transferring) [Sphingomonas desiccabilis]RXZ31514.1 alpha-1,4-glucan--maltose-1-phosphate maltosyltransferase [Sphingomonas desiccabilis]
MPQFVSRLLSIPSFPLPERLLTDAAAVGFDGVLWRADAPVLGDGELVPPPLPAACAEAGLALLVALSLDRAPIDHPLLASHPEAFAIRRAGAGDGPVDPRQPARASGEARARLRTPEAAALLLPVLVKRLSALVDAGIAGFRLLGADRIPPETLIGLISAVRERHPGTGFISGAPDLTRPQVRALAPAGLSAITSSFAWWDLRAPWLVEEYEELRAQAPLLAEVSAATTGNADAPAAVARTLAVAAASANGIILPAEMFAGGGDLVPAVRQALAVVQTVQSYGGEMRALTGPQAPVGVLLRADTGDVRDAGAALLVFVNRSDTPQPLPAADGIREYMGAAFEGFAPVHADGDAEGPLAAGEVRLFTARRAAPIRMPIAAEAIDAGAASPRLVVEELHPRVEGGAFPVKRVVGEQVPVEATVFADGHEQLAVELHWRAADESSWRVARMTQLPNDLWRGSFPLERLGRYEYAIEGWLDRFGGFRRDFTKKLDAGVAQPVDHAEGRALVAEAVARSQGEVRAALAEWQQRLESAGQDSATLLLSPELAKLMDAADDRPHRLRSEPQIVDAERLAARFSSWYELFPRSQTEDASRHGNFDDVIARLPAVRDMGFDTLYFPPIHPIGRTHRKGPNNTLTAGPDDPGSPYAIGSAEGGHDAIHPQLGSPEDFARLVESARAHGLEIALDFAIQASPDHPWLTEHPGWFAWRPDGSMKYAENPPKKYQDIVNVDFYGPDAIPGLWTALRDVILLWVERGVKTFRVDNPHTKPLPFWEWMIGEVRAEHPDVIFLAEAFTRPSMMYRLGKIGFSQSYTYFTWRDDKHSLMEYITELTTTAPKEFYRPHFFVNTPDINPVFLQTSGRPGFRIRAVLAATLSGLFGVYSGFELCEAAPVPGKEEYLDSEKYIVKPRDWQAPGNIIGDITLLNRLRRAHPALQTHLNTRFLPAHNDRVIFYAKPAPDGSEMLLVMVNMDPHHGQDAGFEIPLWEFGIPDDGSVAVEDLAAGHRFRWHGKHQHIRLDPDQPYRIWRIAPGDFA